MTFRPMIPKYVVHATTEDGGAETYRYAFALKDLDARVEELSKKFTRFKKYILTYKAVK